MDIKIYDLRLSQWCCRQFGSSGMWCYVNWASRFWQFEGSERTAWIAWPWRWRHYNYSIFQEV